ncbi:MAG: hypothetical protein HZB21_07345, partial [Deltaproteobacteria bacterium]|nr:hypothetical protein [Deltaproteobacteria bacterium]
RYGLAESRSFTGGSAAAGFTPVKGLSIEASVEGGNYALGGAAGFKYYSAGVKADYMPL